MITQFVNKFRRVIVQVSEDASENTYNIFEKIAVNKKYDRIIYLIVPISIVSIFAVNIAFDGGNVRTVQFYSDTIYNANLGVDLLIIAAFVVLTINIGIKTHSLVRMARFLTDDNKLARYLLYLLLFAFEVCYVNMNFLLMF